MSLKTIKRQPFKRGDTACFLYNLSPPSVGFDWSTVTVDCALTAQTAPTDNTQAAAIRTSQPLTVNADGTASYAFQLTLAESQALIPGTTYIDECQLKQGGLYATTAVTGQTVVAQDYII